MNKDEIALQRLTRPLRDGKPLTRVPAIARCWATLEGGIDFALSWGLQADLGLASYAELAIRRRIDHLLRERGVEVKVTIDFDSVAAVKEAITLGSAISILPARVLEPEVREGRPGGHPAGGGTGAAAGHRPPAAERVQPGGAVLPGVAGGGAGRGGRGVKLGFFRKFHLLLAGAGGPGGRGDGVTGVHQVQIGVRRAALNPGHRASGGGDGTKKSG